VHLPEGYQAPQLSDALIAQTQLIPETWRKTLTWDQGREMSMHEQTAAATGFDIYFCDPHSPWHRGTKQKHLLGRVGCAGLLRRERLGVGWRGDLENTCRKAFR